MASDPEKKKAMMLELEKKKAMMLEAREILRGFRKVPQSSTSLVEVVDSLPPRNLSVVLMSEDARKGCANTGRRGYFGAGTRNLFGLAGYCCGCVRFNDRRA